MGGVSGGSLVAIRQASSGSIDGREGRAECRARVGRRLGLVLLFALLAPVTGLASSADQERLGVGGFGGVEVPRVLSDDDVGRYRQITELQRDARWRAADKVAGRLDNPVLMGHFLFERYMHPTAYRSRFKELKRWLDRHHDHPGADRIYRLAMKRRPKGAGRPKRPTTAEIPLGTEVPRAALARTVPRLAWRGRAHRLERQTAEDLGHDRPTRAWKRLRAEQVRQPLQPASYDAIAAAIARSYYFNGKFGRALEIARAAAERSRRLVHGADWFAGLAAWRRGELEAARHHFGALARSKTAPPAMVAAGAYWASRAHLVDRRPSEVIPYLSVAARYPRTFYGLIARRLLDSESHFDWTPPPLSDAYLRRLLAIPAVRRIVAFCEIERHDLADREVRALLATAPSRLSPVLFALTHRLGMAETQLRLAQRHRLVRGVIHDAALYPMAPWTPKGGYEIDRALVNAFIRRESNFRASATSPAGARGLMQLMPRTASFIAGDRRLNGKLKRRLLEPTYNIQLGQRYLAHLLGNKAIRGNLVLLAIAYNGGPRNARRWFREIDHGEDPLLLIESVPWHETRIFVKRILTNFWIYRDRMGQDLPSLDALATGYWPYYTALDGKSMALAESRRKR